MLLKSLILELNYHVEEVPPELILLFIFILRLG